ncbi:hypothetical protein KGD82_19480 [Nocardiopsis eucommiae]|uniref:Uncharacterized protein n=1 Tax=Nocardiopsis eucommiae TaxID=2831970 RepID=A0A975L6V5_9ACTN|nr:hypothetical protein KGD82_19480 [Nocardiopsis eucommiae]
MREHRDQDVVVATGGLRARGLAVGGLLRLLELLPVTGLGVELRLLGRLGLSVRLFRRLPPCGLGSAHLLVVGLDPRLAAGVLCPSRLRLLVGSSPRGLLRGLGLASGGLPPAGLGLGLPPRGLLGLRLPAGVLLPTHLRRPLLVGLAPPGLLRLRGLAVRLGLLGVGLLGLRLPPRGLSSAGLLGLRLPAGRLFPAGLGLGVRGRRLLVRWSPRGLSSADLRVLGLRLPPPGLGAAALLGPVGMDLRLAAGGLLPTRLDLSLVVGRNPSGLLSLGVGLVRLVRLPPSRLLRGLRCLDLGLAVRLGLLGVGGRSRLDPGRAPSGRRRRLRRALFPGGLVSAGLLLRGGLRGRPPPGLRPAHPQRLGVGAHPRLTAGRRLPGGPRAALLVGVLRLLLSLRVVRRRTAGRGLAHALP